MKKKRLNLKSYLKHKKKVVVGTCAVMCHLYVFGHPYHARGYASYYADRFHGRTMSNGKTYYRDSMTCAHLKYPFGTILRVRNPKNDKQVIVEVTDRGPYSKKFVLDLSRAAAEELGYVKEGFTMVEITQLHPARTPFKPETQNLIPDLHLIEDAPVVYPKPEWSDPEEDAKEPVWVRIKDYTNT